MDFEMDLLKRHRRSPVLVPGEYSTQQRIAATTPQKSAPLFEKRPADFERFFLPRPGQQSRKFL
jgi:hypothetical protein